MPTKPELASDQGCSWQDAGCLHLSLAPGCQLPSLWLAHPKTGFASSSSPGQRDLDWRQHQGPWAGSREEGPDSTQVRGSWMRPCQMGQGSSLHPHPHRGRALSPTPLLAIIPIPMWYVPSWPQEKNGNIWKSPANKQHFQLMRKYEPGTLGSNRISASCARHPLPTKPPPALLLQEVSSTVVLLELHPWKFPREGGQVGRQQTEMVGNIQPGVSTLSQGGMPSSLGFSQVLGKGSGGVFFTEGESCISLLQVFASRRHCKVRQDEGLSTRRCGAETSGSPHTPLSLPITLSQSPIRPQLGVGGLSAGEMRICNLHSSVFDVVVVKANPHLGKLPGHLSAP